MRVMRAGAGFALVSLLALVAEGDVSGVSHSRAVGGAEVGAAAQTSSARGFRYSQWLRDKDAYSTPTLLTDTASPALGKPGSFWGDVAGRLRAGAVDKAKDSLINAAYRGESLAELMLRHHRGGEFDMREWLEINRRQVNDRIGAILPAFYRDAEGVLAGALSEAAAELAFVERARISFETSLGGRKATGGVEAAGALAQRESYVVGWQVRAFAGEDSAKGLNSGLFYRRVVNDLGFFDDSLAGVNLFLDFEDGDLGDFWRWSIGGDLKSYLGELSANRYFAITDAQKDARGNDVYTRSGFDFDFAMNIPRVEWAKARLGYYNFEGEFGDEDDSGLRAGLDLHPGHGLVVGLQYDDNGGEFGGNVSYTHKFGEAAAGASRPAEFDPRAHFFDAVRREYSQRITRAGSGNNNIVIVSANVDSVNVSGNVPFAVSGTTTITATAFTNIPAVSGTVINFGFPLGASNSVTVAAGSRANGTLAIRRGTRWYLTLFENAQVAFRAPVSSAVSVTLAVTRGSGVLLRNSGMSVVQLPAGSFTLIGTRLHFNANNNITLYEGEVAIPPSGINVVAGDRTSVRVGNITAAAASCANIVAGVTSRCEIFNAAVSNIANVSITQGRGAPAVLGNITLAAGTHGDISVILNPSAGFDVVTNAPVFNIRVRPQELGENTRANQVVQATVLGVDGLHTPRMFMFTAGVSVVPPVVISPVGALRAAIATLEANARIGQFTIRGGDGAYPQPYQVNHSGVAGAQVNIGNDGVLMVSAPAITGNLVIVITRDDGDSTYNPPAMFTLTVGIFPALNLAFEGAAASSPVVVTTGDGVNAGADIGAVVAQTPHDVSDIRVVQGGSHVRLARDGNRRASLRYIGNTRQAQLVTIRIQASDNNPDAALRQDTAEFVLNIVNPPDVQLNTVGSPRLTRGTVDAAITAATLAASGGFALDDVEPSMRIVGGANLFEFNPSSGVLVLRGPNLQGRTVQAVIEAADAHRGAAVARATVQVAVSPLELRAGADFVAVKVPRAAAEGRLNLFTVRALGGAGARVLGAVGSPFVFANPDAEGAREVFLPAGAYSANLGNAPASIWSFAVRQPGGEVLQRFVTVAWVRDLALSAPLRNSAPTALVNVDILAATLQAAGGYGDKTFRLLNPPQGWSLQNGSVVVVRQSEGGAHSAALQVEVNDATPQTEAATANVVLSVTAVAPLELLATPSGGPQYDVSLTLTAGTQPRFTLVRGGMPPYAFRWLDRSSGIRAVNAPGALYPDSFMFLSRNGVLEVRGEPADSRLDSEVRQDNISGELITEEGTTISRTFRVWINYVAAPLAPSITMNIRNAVTIQRSGVPFKAADVEFSGGLQLGAGGSSDDAAVSVALAGPASLTSPPALIAVGNELQAHASEAGTITATIFGFNSRNTATATLTLEFVAPIAVTYPSIDIVRTVVVNANAGRSMPANLQLSVITVAAALGDGANVQMQVGNIPGDMTLSASGGGGATPTYTFTPSGAFGGGANGVVSFTPSAPGSHRGQVIVENTHNGFTQRVTAVVNINIEAVPAAPRNSLFIRFVNDLPANARSRPAGVAEVTVGTLAVYGDSGAIGLDTLPANFSADPIAAGVTLTFNTPAVVPQGPIDARTEIVASAFELKHSGAAPAGDVAIVATTDTQNATPGTLNVRLRAGALLLTSTGEPVFYLIDGLNNAGHRVFSVTAVGGLSPYKFEGIGAAGAFAAVHSSEGVNARTLQLYNGAISDNLQSSTNPERLNRTNSPQFEVSDAAGMSATLSTPLFFVKPIRAQARGGYGVLLKGASTPALAAEIEPNDGAGFYTYQLISDYPAGYFSMQGSLLMAQIPASDSRPLFAVTVRVDDRFRDHFDSLNTGVDRAQRPLYSVAATPPLDVKVNVYTSNPLFAPAATVTVHTRANAAGAGGIVRPSGGYGPYRLANASPDTGGNIGSDGLLAINETDANVFGDTGIRYVSSDTTPETESVVRAGEVMVIDFGGLENGDNDILLITQTTTIPVFVSYVHPPQMSVAAHNIVQTAGAEFVADVRVLGGSGDRSIARVLGISGGTIIGAPRIVGGGVQATLRGDSEGDLLLTVRVADSHPAINDIDVVVRARIVSGLGLEVLPFALPSAGQLFTVSLNVRGGDGRVVSYASNPGNNGSYVRYDFVGDAVVLRAGSAGNMRIVVQVSDETPATPIQRTIAARVLDGFHFTNQSSAPITVTTSFPGNANFQLPRLQFSAVGRAGSPSYDIPEILVTNNFLNEDGNSAQTVFTAAARYSLSNSGVLSYIGASPPIFPTDDEVILRAQSAGQTALGTVIIRYVHPRAVEVAFADPRQTLRFAQRGGEINIGNISIGGGWAPTRQLHLVGASDFRLVTTGGNVALRLGGDNTRARTVQAVVRGTDGHHGSYDGFMSARVTVNNLPVSVRARGVNLYHAPGAGALQIGTLIVDGGIGGGYGLAAANGFTYTPLTLKVTGESFVTREVSVGVARHPDTNQNVPIYENRAFPVTANKHAFAVQLNAPNNNARTIAQVFRGTDSDNATPDGMLTLTIIVKQPQAFMRLDGFNGSRVNNTGALSIGAIVASSDVGPLSAHVLVSESQLGNTTVYIYASNFRVSGAAGAQVLYLSGDAGAYRVTLRATDDDLRTADAFLTLSVTLRNELSGPNQAVIQSQSPDNLDVLTVTTHGNSNTPLTVLRDPAKVYFLETGFPRDISVVIVTQTTTNPHGGMQLTFGTMTVTGNVDLLPGAVTFRINQSALAAVAGQSAADRVYLYTLQYAGVDDKILTIRALPLVARLLNSPVEVGAFRRTILVSGMDDGRNFQRQGNASWNVDSNGVISGNAAPGVITGTVRIDDNNAGYEPIDFIFSITALASQVQNLTLTAYTRRALAGAAVTLADSVANLSIVGGFGPPRRNVTFGDVIESIVNNGVTTHRTVRKNIVTYSRLPESGPVAVRGEYNFIGPNGALRVSDRGVLAFAGAPTPGAATLVAVPELITYTDTSTTPPRDIVVYMGVQYVNPPQVMVTAQQLANALTLRRVPTLTTGGVPNQPTPEAHSVTVHYGIHFPQNAVGIINFNDGNRTVDVVAPVLNNVIQNPGAQAVNEAGFATVYLDPIAHTMLGMVSVTVVTYDESRPESGTVETAFTVDLRSELRMTAFDDGVAFTYRGDEILYSFHGNFNVVRGDSQEATPRGLALLAVERTNNGNLINELPVLLEVTGGGGNVTYENPGNGFTWTGGILRYDNGTFGALHTAAVTITNVNENPGDGSTNTEIGVYYMPRTFVTLTARSGADYISRVATVYFRTRPGAARPPATAPTPPVTVSYDYNDILVATPRQFFGAGESDVAVATVNVASGVTPATDSSGFQITTAEASPQAMTVTTRVEFFYTRAASPIFPNSGFNGTIRSLRSIVITATPGVPLTLTRNIGSELQGQGSRNAEIRTTDNTGTYPVGNTNIQIDNAIGTYTLFPYPALAGGGGNMHLLLFTDASATSGAHYATVTADDDNNAATAPGRVYATLTLAPQITPVTATVTVAQGSQRRGIIGTLSAQGGTPPYGFIPQGLDLINAEVQPLGPASLRAVGIKSDGEIHLLANRNLQTPGLFTLNNIEVSDNTPAPYNTRKATAQMLLLSVAPPPPSLQITVSYSNLVVTAVVTSEVAAYTITNTYGEDADAKNGTPAIPTTTVTTTVDASTTRITSSFLSGGAVRMQFGNGNVSLSVIGYSPGDLALSDDFPRALTARLTRRALARITLTLAAPNGGSATRVLSLQMNGGAPRIAEYLLSSELTVAIGASGVGTVEAANVELMGVSVSDNSYQFSVEALIPDTTLGYDYSRTRLQVITVNNNRRLRVESIPGSARFNYRIHVWHNGFATNAPGQFGATNPLPLVIAEQTTPLTAQVNSNNIVGGAVTIIVGGSTGNNASIANITPSGGTAPYVVELQYRGTWYSDSSRIRRFWPDWLSFNNNTLRKQAGTGYDRTLPIRVRDANGTEFRFTLRLDWQ